MVLALNLPPPLRHLKAPINSNVCQKLHFSLFIIDLLSFGKIGDKAFIFKTFLNLRDSQLPLSLADLVQKLYGSSFP